METYPVDIDPAQIVRWVKAEQETSPTTFRITAMRSREVQEIPVRRELHLGDEEREDLSEIETVATLEIAPAQTMDGWVLRIIVEDEIGPRISEGQTSVAEQQIDLGTFYHQFIRPGRGTAIAVGEFDGAAAKLHLTRVLEAIEKNLHAAAKTPQPT